MASDAESSHPQPTDVAGCSERPGDDVARLGLVAAGRAVRGVGRNVVDVDADPHAVTSLTAGEVGKARGERLPDSSVSSVLGDGQLVQEHLGPLVWVGRLDTADEADGPPVIVEGDEQVVARVREEGVAGFADRWTVVQRSRSLNLLDGGRLEDPHETDATSIFPRGTSVTCLDWALVLPRKPRRSPVGLQNRDNPPVERSRVPSLRLTLRSWIYVVAVTSTAAVGFTGQSPWPILLAVLLAIPASLVTVPCYYVAYGLLALIPGANPSSSSGSETFAPDGRLLSSVSTGMPAAWFTITTFVLGILALAAAAFLNVLLLRVLAARRRGKRPGND